MGGPVWPAVGTEVVLDVASVAKLNGHNEFSMDHCAAALRMEANDVSGPHRGD